MAASLNEVNFLFVVGAARSGTTYVTDVLDEYFDYGMSPEGHFVLQIANKLKQYGPLSIAENMTHLLEDVRQSSTLSIIREQWPVERRFDVTLEQLRENLLESSFAGVVYSVFKCIAARLRRRNIGSKNPQYTTCLPMLEGLFPGRAKYLNVIRDGRDVALSTMRMPWGQKSAYACAKSWSRYIDLAMAFEQQVGPQRFMNIRYESFVEDPVPCIERLETFLGYNLSHDRRAAFLDAASSNRLSNNFGKWKSDLGARDRVRYEAVAGHNLRRMNYEVECASPSIGILEKAGFEIHDFGRAAYHTLRQYVKNRSA